MSRARAAESYAWALERGSKLLLVATLASAFAAWAGLRIFLIAAAALLAIVLLAPLLTRRNTRELELATPRRLTVHAGDRVRVLIDVHNRSTHAARDLLMTIAEGRRMNSYPTGHVPMVAAGQHIRAEVHSRFAERGRQSLLHVVLSSSFPFGLLRRSVTYELPCELTVLPRIGRLRHFDRLLDAHAGKRFELGRGRATGEEFYALRDWRAGESLRGVHWKLSARRGRTIVREHRNRDRPLVRVVLCTLTGPREWRERWSPLFERAVRLAATIVHDCMLRGHRVGLSIAGTERVDLPLSRSRQELSAKLVQLALVAPERGNPRRSFSEQAWENAETAIFVFVGAPEEQFEAGDRPVICLNVNAYATHELFETETEDGSNAPRRVIPRNRRNNDLQSA